MKKSVKHLYAVLFGTCAFTCTCLGVGIAKNHVSANEINAFSYITDAESSESGFLLDPNGQKGGLYFGVKDAESLKSEGLEIDGESRLYAVTEFILGDKYVYDYDDGGLLMQINTVGNTRPVETNVYVFRHAYGKNRFLFVAGGTGTSSRTDTLVLDDGTFSGVSVEKNNSRAMIPASVSGTWNIPWKTLGASSTVDEINGLFTEEGAELRVLVLTAVSGGGAVAGEGLSVANISTYDKVGQDANVVTGFDANSVSYATDENDAASNVNSYSPSLGKTVNTKKKWDYTNGISVNNYGKDSESLACAFIEYGTKVKATFTDGTGTTVEDNSYATVKNVETEGGLTTFEFIQGGTAPAVAHYSFENVDSSALVSGKTLNFVYNATALPQLLVHRVDRNGQKIAPDEYATVTDNEGVYSYSVSSDPVGKYNFVYADGELSGTIGEDGELTLTYAEFYGEFTDFTARRDEDGALIGIGLSTSMEGAFWVGIKDDAELPDGVHNAVTEFKLGNTVHDYENGGLLIQFETVGYADVETRVHIFVNGTNNRFYSVVAGIKSSRNDVCIFWDGSQGEIKVQKSSSKYNAILPADTVGTWNIRWKDILDNTGGVIAGIENPTMRVLIQTDVSHATAQDKVGNGVSVGTIATYWDKNGYTTVVPGIKTTELSYSYDKDDTESDVNIADISNGKKIYTRNCWDEGIGKDYYKPDTSGETVGLVRYDRTSNLTVPVDYVDEKGTKLQNTGFARVTYGQNGLRYSVTAQEFVGYAFKSSDKPLQGDIDGSDDGFSVTLVYEKVAHNVTMKFYDTDGNEIASPKVTSAFYGDYLELSAPVIDGYEFVESSRSLKITVMNDYTIKLTYEKVATGGCNSSLHGTEISFAVFGAVIVALLGRKRRKL